MKILYISLIDWNWIKQRPQIIAEGLSNRNEVFFLYPRYYRKTSLSQNDSSQKKLHLIPRFKIPFSARNSLLKEIDNCIGLFVEICHIHRIRPDVIYITHPNQYRSVIRKSCRYLIYDCMDNYSEFEKNSHAKRRLTKKELKVCNDANDILVSSEHLKKKIMNYGIDGEKITLVRNAFSDDLFSKVYSGKKIRNSGKHIITYVGTIGTWIDFDLLVRLVEENKDIEVHLAGPAAGEIPVSDRLVYDGIINHRDLIGYTEQTEVFIMPFVVNTIVEAVDPVKLYEYIFFDKPIVSVYYAEIEHFRDFIYFYQDYNSFNHAIRTAVSEKENKYSENERKLFLKNNTWNQRIETIETVIKRSITGE